MKSRPTNVRAFSLVEVALALGVAAFCLITLMALLPVGITSNKFSLQETTAASLATGVISDLQAATNSTVSPAAQALISPQYGIAIPAVGGSVSVTAPAVNLFLGNDGTAYSTATSTGARFRVSIGFNPPGAGSRAATATRVLVSWPAQGDSTANWPTSAAGAFEIFTALNCN